MNVRRLILVAPLCVACLLLSAWSSPAQKPGDKVSLAPLHRALANEDYAAAGKHVESVLRRGTLEQRQEAMLCHGRVLLGSGQKNEAERYLAAMSPQKLDANGKQLMQVYRAWLMALSGKPKPAVKNLEAIVAAKTPHPSTAEAADVLAMIHLERGEHEKAAEVVAAGREFLKYYGKKTPYVETLLRNRLHDHARKLHDKAQRLRREGKTAEAAEAFLQVCSRYPKSKWRHPAGYRVGECLIALERFEPARAHLNSFVEQSPGGPWRGQARLALIDLAIERDFDLAAAADHAALAASTLRKGVEKDAADSWKRSAAEIHLRQAVLTLTRDRHKAAAEAVAEAKRTAARGDAELRAGLDCLSWMAFERQNVLPAELTGGDPRETLLASVGRLYNLLGRHDRAAGALEPLLAGRDRSRSLPHRSFAALEMARAKVGLGKFDEAKDYYERSLREQPDAPWGDRTLRELALLVERSAEKQVADRWAKNVAKAAKSRAQAASRSNDKKKADRSSPPGHEVAWEASLARTAALPHWEGLVARYPRSPHVPEALHRVGTLRAEGAAPDHQKAFEAFELLASRHSDSAHAGDARVRLIDVKLERQLDLKGAAKQVAEAIDWLDRRDKAELKRAARATVADGGNQPAGDAAAPVKTADGPIDHLLARRSSGPRALGEVCHDVYVRAGLLEYLNQKPKKAAEYFEKAKPFAPPRDFVVVHGEIPTGIERLIAAAQSEKSLTPECVLAGDPTAKLCLMLADLYHEGEDWTKSFDLCNRLLHGASPRATPEQRSWALFKRGRNYYCFDSLPGARKEKGSGKAAAGDQDATNVARLYFDPEAALADYVAAVKAAPRSEWADNAMFLAANILWNHRQDAGAAVAVWQRLLRDYPRSEEADRSAYFVGVVYMLNDQTDQAQEAFNQYLTRHPGSAFAQAAAEHLNELKTMPSSTETTKSRSPNRDTTRARRGGG